MLKKNLLFFSGILTTFNPAVFGNGKLLRDVEHQLEKKTFLCSTFAYKYLRAIHESIGGEKIRIRRFRIRETIWWSFPRLFLWLAHQIVSRILNSKSTNFCHQHFSVLQQSVLSTWKKFNTNIMLIEIKTFGLGSRTQDVCSWQPPWCQRLKKSC